MKKRIIVYLTIFQVIIIFTIIHEIHKKNTSTLGVGTLVNSSSHEEMIFPQLDGLKHFYEPKPGKVNTIRLDWDNTNGPEFPTYKINADGLNQLTELEVEKPKGVFRIVTLGDSFTFGQYVNTQDNYPSQLQAILDKECKNSKFEVLNLGVGGYDIKYAVERFKLRGQKYNPDLILWLVIADDLRRINELLRPRSQQYYQEMKESGEYDEAIKNGKFGLPWKKAREEIVNELGVENVYKMQRVYFKELREYYANELVLMRFDDQFRDKELLEEVVGYSSNTFFHDKIPNPGNYDGKLPDGHPSPKGYKLMTENIFDYLVKSGLINCK